MPQNIHLSPPVRSAHWPQRGPIAVILLAGLAIAILATASRGPDTTAQPAQIEDWHGNVMRSHWTAEE